MDFKPLKIGKFLLLEKLATGGMAEVYRAKASGAGGFEKQLAVKRILPSYSSNEEFRRMFEYEARLSSMLTHANIVQIYDFVKSGETYLLSMEFVDGKNLRQLINKARRQKVALPLEFCIFVTNEVCKGLDYAHKKRDDITGKPLNIIHRDMSPQNIMLSYDAAVKIVDFGIAKAKDRVEETRSGVIKGKFGYMSPEQANGESLIDHRTDIFSTGIIQFELLCGRRLFAAENDMATLKLIQECAIPLPSRVNPRIPLELEKIMLKTLMKDRGTRYQSAGVLEHDLQEFLARIAPGYTQRDAAAFIQRIFAEDIQLEKKRFEQVYRQSIPFSQAEGFADPNEKLVLSSIEEALEEESTSVESELNTEVTVVEEAAQRDESFRRQGVSAVDSTKIEGSGEGQAESTFARVSSPSSAGALTQRGSRVPAERPDGAGADGRLSPSPASLHGAKKPLLSENTGITGALEEPAQSTQSRSPAMSFAESGGERVSVLESLHETGSKRMGSGIELTSPSMPASPQTVVEIPTIIRGEEAQPASVVTLQAPSSTASQLAPDPRAAPGSIGEIRFEVPPDLYEDRFTRPSQSGGFGRWITVRALGGLIITAIVAYFVIAFYSERRLPALIDSLGERPLSHAAPQRSSSVSALPARAAPKAGCLLEVESEPAGARVVVNGMATRSWTPASLFLPCRAAVNLSVDKPGFECAVQNIVPQGKKSRFYFTLRRIPMGTLELTLSENVNVLDDRSEKLLGHVQADSPVQLRLRAGQPVRLRFTNPILGINGIYQFTVRPDQVTREHLSLSPARLPSAARTPSRHSRGPRNPGP